MVKKLKRKATNAADVPAAKRAKTSAPSISPTESPSASPKASSDALPKTGQPLATSSISESGKFPKKLKAKKRKKLEQAKAANLSQLKKLSDAPHAASLEIEAGKLPKKLKAKKRKKHEEEALPIVAPEKKEVVAQKKFKAKRKARKEKAQSASLSAESNKLLLPKKEMNQEKQDASLEGERQQHTGMQTEDKNHMKVFIGGIPFNTDLETLQADFEECGELDAFVYPKDDQGRFKGIAFATYKTRQSVEKALSYDGSDYGGRVLKVAMATPRRASGQDKGGKGSGKDNASKGKGSKKGDKGSKTKTEKGKKGPGKNEGKIQGKGKGKGNKSGKTEKGSKEKKKFGFELSSEED